ncbi:unnamed protein product [Debaryomyces tyrocola]|nr:unnamed protein product [Debaryomyces tyrocola]
MPTSFYDEIHQVPNLFARATYSVMADIDRYTPGEAHTTRICAIVSSSISIFAGIIGIYFFLAIDYKKRVFRHQLIFFLILYDCIKALFLLLYPARVVAKASVYYDLKFCKVVGFFTALSIEGSDIAILSFAIHIALLVFKPNQTVKRGMSYEGGLFRYRYYVYAISILLPILLASLAFINGVGYAPLTNWCYMPTSPLWYRLVLSWIPRYLIIITIFVIYGCVYRHVTKQYSNVRNTMIRPDESEHDNTSTWKRFYKALGFVLFLNVFTSDSLKKDGKNDTSINKEEQPSNFVNDSSYDNQSREERLNNDHNLIPGNLNEDALQQFRRRQKQVERQMKTIFIYPVSYVLLWTFPLIVQAVNFKYTNSNNKPIVWLSSLSAFMKAFNCTVDTVVFLIREKPWKIITSKVDTSPTEKYTYSRWRHFISFLPLFSLPKSHEDSPNYALNNSFSDPIFHDYSKVLSDTGHVDVQLTQLTSNKLNVNNNNASISPNKHLHETNSEHNNSDEEIPDEIDFTEFLKMGPPR